MADVGFVHDPGRPARQDLRMPPADPRIDALTAIPNVGPAVARRLVRLGIAAPEDLCGRDPEELFDRLAALDGYREDPCLLDTFTAAVAFAEGGPALPWWHHSRLRKAAE
jgi:hypothetical protein